MRKIFQFPVSCLACTTLILAACQQGGGGTGAKKPQTPPTHGQEQPPPSQEQQAQEQGQGQGQGQTQNQPNTQSTENVPKETRPTVPPVTAPPPSTTIPNAPSIARLINPTDDTLILLSKYLMEVHPDAIESTRDQLVNEIFSDEDQAQGKILEIQASVAKIANHGLYSNDVKGRIAFLQSRLVDQIQSNQYYDVLEKGVFFVASGAVLGGLAGTNAIPWVVDHAPNAVPAIKNAAQYTRDALRDKFNAIYQRSTAAARELRATVRDRERLNAFVDNTKAGVRKATNATLEAGTRVKNQIVDAARAPFKSAEKLVSENLEDLGLQKYDLDALGELTPVRRSDLVDNIEFRPTNKANFQYAILDTMYGMPLGIQRVVAFRQQRIIRGSPFETIFVTHPVDAGFAGNIASHLTVDATQPAGRFVNFMNLKTGVVSTLRWPVDKFTAMLKSADVSVQPLFQSLKDPRTVGTAALSATGFGIYYWWGYGNGEQNAQQYGAVDLENMIQRGNQPPVAVSNLESSHP